MNGLLLNEAIELLLESCETATARLSPSIMFSVQLSRTGREVLCSKSQMEVCLFAEYGKLFPVPYTISPAL